MEGEPILEMYFVVKGNAALVLPKYKNEYLLNLIKVNSSVTANYSTIGTFLTTY